MNRKINIILSIVAIAFTIVAMILGIYGNYTIENKPVKYAIGTIHDFVRGARAAPFFDYDFIINKKEYSGRYSIEGDLRNKSNNYLEKFIGKKFFVRFNSDQPYINRLMIEHPFNDCQIDDPDSGWVEIPKCE